MNIRQQKYKKNRLLGMNPENAAVAAGFSVSYARAKAYRIERSAKVGMADAFERAGLTDKAIVTHALEGLNAMKLQSCNIFISKPNAESIDADKLIINKNSNDFVEVEDWANRHKYFNTICEMTERIKHKVEHSGEVKGGQRVVVFIQEKDGFTDKSKEGRFSTQVSVVPE